MRNEVKHRSDQAKDGPPPPHFPGGAFPGSAQMPPAISILPAQEADLQNAVALFEATFSSSKEETHYLSTWQQIEESFNCGNMLVSRSRGEFCGLITFAPVSNTASNSLINNALFYASTPANTDFFISYLEDYRRKNGINEQASVTLFDSSFNQNRYYPGENDGHLSLILVTESERRNGHAMNLLAEAEVKIREKGGQAIFAFCQEGCGSEELLSKNGYKAIMRVSPAPPLEKREGIGFSTLFMGKLIQGHGAILEQGLSDSSD